MKNEPLHPIKHANGTLDLRYKIALEYCGYSCPFYVVRFCDDRIGACINYQKALYVAATHDAERMATM